MPRGLRRRRRSGHAAADYAAHPEPQRLEQPVRGRRVADRRADVVVRAQRPARGDDHALPAQAACQLRAGESAARSARRSWPDSRRRPPEARPRASNTRARSRMTDWRRRSTSASPILSACSTADWVRAFTPSTGGMASSSFGGGGAHGVAGAQARQAVDLREGPHHEQPREGVDEPQARVDRPRRPGSGSAPRRPARARGRGSARRARRSARRSYSCRSGRWGCTARPGGCGPSPLRGTASRRSTETGRAPARAAISGYRGYDGHGVSSSSPAPRRANAADCMSSAAPLPTTMRSGSTACTRPAVRRTPSAWRSGYPLTRPRAV